MFCHNCGAEISDNAVVCPKCGVAVGKKQTVDYNDAPSVGFAVLSFFIPIIGLILYLVWKDQSPLKAKSCGKGALIGFCVSVALSVLSGILYSCAIVSVLSAL